MAHRNWGWPPDEEVKKPDTEKLKVMRESVVAASQTVAMNVKGLMEDAARKGKVDEDIDFNMLGIEALGSMMCMLARGGVFIPSNEFRAIAEEIGLGDVFKEWGNV